MRGAPAQPQITLLHSSALCSQSWPAGPLHSAPLAACRPVRHAESAALRPLAQTATCSSVQASQRPLHGHEMIKRAEGNALPAQRSGLPPFRTLAVLLVASLTVILQLGTLLRREATVQTALAQRHALGRYAAADPTDAPARAPAAAGLQGPPPPKMAVQGPPPPKIALLFLTRGPLPHEPLWKAFLESTNGGADWRQLFSLHTHPPPEFSHPAGSLFAGCEVSGRVKVAWGGHSMIDAERALLRAALADPAAQRFVLLSDSCVPLYPAPLVWAQLLGEQKSRVSACWRTGNHRQEYRWHPNMHALGVPKGKWRKSNQWFMLTRPHAEAMVGDTVVDTAFRQECYCKRAETGKNAWIRFCPSDEHYVPTLLAVLGKEAETECGAEVTHVHWAGPYFHPMTYGKDQATAAVLGDVRGGANCSTAAGPLAAASREALLRIAGNLAGWAAGPPATAAGQQAAAEEPPGGNTSAAAAVFAAGSAAGAPSSTPAAAPVAAGAASAGGLTSEQLGEAAGLLLSLKCPLFARKVAADAAPAWLTLLAPVMQPG